MVLIKIVVRQTNIPILTIISKSLCHAVPKINPNSNIAKNNGESLKIADIEFFNNREFNKKVIANIVRTEKINILSFIRNNAINSKSTKNIFPIGLRLFKSSVIIFNKRYYSFSFIFKLSAGVVLTILLVSDKDFLI